MVFLHWGTELVSNEREENLRYSRSVPSHCRYCVRHFAILHAGLDMNKPIKFPNKAYSLLLSSVLLPQLIPHASHARQHPSPPNASTRIGGFIISDQPHPV